MRRTLSASKDTYIQNKRVGSIFTTDANVGQAASLDLFKLYNETYVSGSSSVVELSRLLVKFDLAPLRALTGSILNISSPNFKCFLTLKSVYGGQTTPSNFSMVLYPLSKSFDEGRGIDVYGYRDIDTANWLTASVVTGTPVPWTLSGSGTSGSVGSSTADYVVSGNFGSGLVPLAVRQQFSRGDESLNMDVTTIISASLVGLIPDHGFRLGFIEAEENDVYTRFVKRFGSRHIKDFTQRPSLEVFYDNSTTDNSLSSYIDYPNTTAIYNTVFGSYRNFMSGTTQITGSNSLALQLVASKSVTYWTSSYSITHSASINHLTSGWVNYSVTFPASQQTINGMPQTGIYTSNFFLSSSDVAFNMFTSGSNTIKFQPLWKSLDGTVLYSSGSMLTVKRINGGISNVAEKNFVINVTNLKETYTNKEISRLRLFIQDYNTEMSFDRIPLDLTGQVYSNVHWRLVHAFTRKVIIPYDFQYSSTKLSSDGKGMYFDVWMSDLEPNQVYELEFNIRENDQDYYVLNQGFRFKVIV